MIAIPNANDKQGIQDRVRARKPFWCKAKRVRPLKTNDSIFKVIKRA